MRRSFTQKFAVFLTFTRLRRTSLTQTGIALALFILQLGCAALGNRDVLRLNDDPVAREAQNTRDEVSSPYEGLSNHSNREELNQEAVEAGDVVLGMNMEQVMSSWGRPSDVEIAGDAESGNQKWTYSGGLMGRLKINPARIVYFERGRVAGWETQ